MTTAPTQIFSTKTGAPLVSKTVKDGAISTELKWELGELKWDWVGKKEFKLKENELFVYSWGKQMFISDPVKYSIKKDLIVEGQCKQVFLVN